MGRIDDRLAELRVELPETNPPQGNYLPFIKAGSLVFIAGQGPRVDGRLLYKGTVGADLSFEDGCDAARICALNLLGQLRIACEGDLDRVVRFVRIAGLVRCTAEFGEQARVLNAASDLIGSIFGDAGRHARIASGTHSLPAGMAVEIEGVVEVR